MFYIFRIIFFICVVFTSFLIWIYSSTFSFNSFASISKIKENQIFYSSKISTSPNENNYFISPSSSVLSSSKNESIQTWNDSISEAAAAENQTFNSGSSSQKLPLILAYDKYFDKSFFTSKVMDKLQRCKFKCEYSENQTLYPYADVALFHSRDFSINWMLWTNKNPNRLNVLSSLESLPNDGITGKWIPKEFFNATMTFRKDSTIWMPYDKFEEFQPHEKDNDTLVWNDKQVVEKISKKSKVAVIFVSNCDTDSKREKYLRELKKYINFTSHGSCYNRSAEKEETLMNFEVDQHYFYLAFENSVCKDYVTEKFWRIKDLIVPVVLKRSILNGIVENEYFIAADDFETPKQLAQKLINLTQNIDEYKTYLGWTKKYEKTKHSSGTVWSNAFCQLCEKATKKEKHEIKDIFQWWENDAKCEAKFALKFLPKSNNLYFYLLLFVIIFCLLIYVIKKY